jgi:hypothetical protein
MRYSDPESDVIYHPYILDNTSMTLPRTPVVYNPNVQLSFLGSEAECCVFFVLFFFFRISYFDGEMADLGVVGMDS